MNRLITSSLMLLAVVSGLHANEKPDKGARITLISEASVIAPGETFRVGIQVEHAEGYHSYWKNPGIVGFATSVEWQMPEGFEAGAISWPYPEIVDMAGFKAHGYHRDLTLTIPVTAPDKIDSETITLSGRIAWMACSDACYPGDETYSITIPVGDSTKINPDTKELFCKSDSEVPKMLEDWKAILLSEMDAKEIRMKLTPSESSNKSLQSPYFFSTDGQIADGTPKVDRQDDGSIILSFARSEYSPKGLAGLPGILRYENRKEIIFARLTGKTAK